VNDPLQQLLQSAGLETPRLPPTSRYAAVGTATLTDAAGRTVVYLRRRFVPPADHFALIQEHTVAPGERLDQIAARYLGDPEQFWRICDANNALDPAELTAPGRRLRITLPEGVPGPRDA
jgi:nucleoid-associated protein YgaU